MAKQKPKYSQSELKKIGQPYDYDAIGFKNSQIDTLRSKMNSDFAARQAEMSDIVDPKYAGYPMPTKSGKMINRVHVPGLDPEPEPVLRDYLIDKTFNVTGPLTGKKGVSKSALKENLPKMQLYRQNERADVNKSSTMYADSVSDAKRWAQTQAESKRNVAKFDSTVKAQGGKFDLKNPERKSTAITRTIDPSVAGKMKPLPTSKTTRITSKATKSKKR